jgi:hypothetical protein
MALTAKVELPDGSFFENAYLKVKNINIVSEDFEFYPTDSETVQWTTKSKFTAMVWVWVDKTARDNRAIPSHWFMVEGDYDCLSEKNIFVQAYDRLNQTKFDGQATYV